MTRFIVSVAVTVTCLLHQNSAATAPPDGAKAKLYQVGDQTQLLIDEAFFDQSHNVRLRLQPPRKTGEKILTRERPWESAIINWFTVREDQGVIDREARYRMWYEAYDLESLGKSDQDEDTMDNTSFCYAESRDGVQWTRPELGLFAFRGSKENNILFRQIGPAEAHSRVHGAGVFLDPQAPTASRYKAVSQGMWAGRGKGFFGPFRIAGMVSPDGLNWTRLPEPICDMFADSQYSGFWDAELGKYVLFGRVSGRGRALGRSESDEFARFPPLERVLQTDEKDPAKSDLYNCAVTRYPYAANVYLMFPSLYQHTPDTLDIRLATSRDGIQWSWPEQASPYIPLGEPDSSDGGSLYMGQGMLRRGDELSLYYSGSRAKHQHEGLSYLKQPENGRVYRRAVTQLDRFVAADGDAEEGWFVTPPLHFQGDHLTLNLVTRDGGSVRVGLLDAAGRPLPGRSAKDCIPIQGDHIQAPVRWGEEETRIAAEKPLRLRIEMTSASLYAFRFSAAAAE